MGNHEKYEKKMKKKSFSFRKKKFDSDTDTKIGPWFRFPIPKPGFGRKLKRAQKKVDLKSTIFDYFTFLATLWTQKFVSSTLFYFKKWVNFRLVKSEGLNKLQLLSARLWYASEIL